ncbi:MAG: LysR family transcriptional regulator [Alphaproteobacteria bacterium]|jgi:LysR family transcriptional regulator, glycine cleavage system transcriptional activator|nr:LysR family transcriptional regulator [Alphaproteobacteria bacterium]MBU0804225.1 LysR family transcriptional regulator [Alphaproteobacteria bacterium]MBU0871056.1 LysR family transcriptional regulator [Alphaproteobacteria bacterium]MBU1400811.1 LysR family transcriptional regulator [Alphaproteobacteria bacterium]MBU1592772.1 LysR family transcriptional regulator [Alphaproteobacteria bacterium]
MHHVPLNWLKTFECVARLLSFQNAARELHVTTGAVSQQIRKLEDVVGASLFLRSRSPIALTVIGEAYFREIQEPLEKLYMATRQIEKHKSPGPLRIWGSRFFIRLWLLQHLASFRSLHPDIELSIETGKPNEGVPSDVDIAIRVGRDSHPDLKHQELMPRIVIPVCSPAYAREQGLTDAGGELSRYTLLCSSTTSDEWQIWAAANAIDHGKLSNIVTLSSSDLVHGAALEGVGISLGRLGFIEKEIEQGHLIALHGHSVDLGKGFVIHYRRDAMHDPRVRAFFRWIKSEVADTIANSHHLLGSRYDPSASWLAAPHTSL